MASEYAIITLEDCCLGCGICQIACEMEHNLTAGDSWIKVRPVLLEGWDGCHTGFVTVYCRHCIQPVCKEACPQGAITRRDDGIVIIDETLCCGCKACLEACPLGAIQFNEEKAVARKCDLCFHRLENGLQPACAAACPNNCIYVGKADEIYQEVYKRRGLSWYADNLLKED